MKKCKLKKGIYGFIERNETIFLKGGWRVRVLYKRRKRKILEIKGESHWEGQEGERMQQGNE